MGDQQEDDVGVKRYDSLREVERDWPTGSDEWKLADDMFSGRILGTPATSVTIGRTKPREN
jgi:hypothetical protein